MLFALLPRTLVHAPRQLSRSTVGFANFVGALSPQRCLEQHFMEGGARLRSHPVMLRGNFSAICSPTVPRPWERLVWGSQYGPQAHTGLPQKANGAASP